MNIFLKLLGRLASFLLTGLALIVISRQASAQDFGRSDAVSDPFESQYFINRYLGNPAMAGLDSTLTLNAAYRKQFSDLPGAPVTEAFSADYNPGKRVGLGLIAYNDKAGLISRSRFALTYAYHLPVGLYGQQLHFGISAAFAHANLDPKDIVGDQNDPAITDFNGRKDAFEVDYGMAYTGEHITLQASLSNLISFMKKFNNSIAEVPTVYAAAAYKFIFNGVVNSLEPQVSVLGVKNYNSLVNGGVNLVMFHQILNISGIIHGSGSFSAGIGLNYKNIIHIQGSYLSQTSGLRNYTDGNYEIDLGISLFRKK